MKKITGHKPASISTKQLEKAAKTEKTAAPAVAAKAKETKPAAGFPRTGWADGAKLSKSIDSAHRTESHPKLVHTKPQHKDPIGGTDTHAPPIAMRYGLRPPDHGHPTPPPVHPPPIAMRYGLRPPDHNGPTPPPAPKPPIAMRYGLRPPNPGHPTDPPVKPHPIAMRYGLRPPNPNFPTDPPVKPPPIAMRYGLRPPPRH